MMSHANLAAGVDAIRSRLGTAYIGKDIYVAYLPLAHVLELVLEMVCALNGIRLG